MWVDLSRPLRHARAGAGARSRRSGTSAEHPPGTGLRTLDHPTPNHTVGSKHPPPRTYGGSIDGVGVGMVEGWEFILVGGELGRVRVPSCSGFVLVDFA